ncbi:MAG: hypothetical protein LRZ92_03140 [Methanosarcinaceae archaeon]|nr:hypothetical protein [Methanosarcinaceae archaeon]
MTTRTISNRLDSDAADASSSSETTVYPNDEMMRFILAGLVTSESYFTTTLLSVKLTDASSIPLSILRRFSNFTAQSPQAIPIMDNSIS